MRAPKDLDFSLIDDYNNFLEKTCENPDLMKLKVTHCVIAKTQQRLKIIKNIDVHLVYTDTDSSYVTLPQLNQLIIKPEY